MSDYEYTPKEHEAKARFVVGTRAMFEKSDQLFGLDTDKVAEAEWDRYLDEHDRKVREQAKSDALREAIQAHRDLHPTYGNTAVCRGGVGGQALTQHCAVVCDNPAHDAAKEAWRQVERTYFKGVARA